MAHIIFTINYHIAWGERVCLCGSTPELGNLNEDRAVTLIADGDNWSAIVDIEETTDISYYYFIRRGRYNVRREWGNNRKLHITKGRKKFVINDLWKDKSHHSYLYTTVFTDSVFRHTTTPLPSRYYSRTVLLNVICPYVARDQILVITGECEELGIWDLKLAKPLSYVDEWEWQITLDAKKLPAKSEYKFVIVDKKSGDAIHWEDGENRELTAAVAHRGNSVQVEMALQFHCQSFAYRGTGTAIPVFSLRTEDSFGVGDFSDLRKMVDWVALTRQQLIQLLPVNDTTATKTWRDSYPYSAISAYALHPIYLGYSDYPLKVKKKHDAFLKEAKELNNLQELDYEKALSLKIRYGRELYLQDGEKVLYSEEYLVFREKNEAWLFPYICYCFLRDKYGFSNFRKWDNYSVYDEGLLKKMVDADAEAKEETQFWAFLQYLLHQQFYGVKIYANEKGVALKGDIPIGINRNSIDAWVAPDLYRMDTQSGAPPDDFSFFGQNWGFPTYNWPMMEKDGYAWWVSRFRKMADYFDAYRIDHILGFFRIWEIPLDAVQGLLGHFSPAQPYCIEEINRAGIPFDEERMAQPFIHEHFLKDIFGEYTDEVKREYLEITGWQRFKLKPYCDTQRKVKQLFYNKEDSKSRRVGDGLMSLCSEVLFVRDLLDHYRFHPRITAQYTHSYQYLDAHIKEVFNQLYDEFFYHRHNNFWREEAMKKLPPLISSTEMMVCAEDLGMVPDCVPSVMHELQMLSLEIERMPKDPYVTFTNLQRLPYLSVCTTSTHDMSPLRLWWTENRELTRHYYNEVLHCEGVAPAECGTALCRKIIERHLCSSAMWVILPLQDWLSIDEELRNPDIMSERINIPANPEHYWRYRMHITLDDLLRKTAFNKELTMLVNGRWKGE
ncbi:MAG: 4-alpha-glucanotransferase [Proteiniphilum sp.]